ncbi:MULTISPECIES: hypothetical protein [unclassified Acinetobacter]|jgi:hypothetical protein|nr:MULTISPECIES: hypothetical protein [unclassified Acinetobacter]
MSKHFKESLIALISILKLFAIEILSARAGIYIKQDLTKKG